MKKHPTTIQKKVFTLLVAFVVFFSSTESSFAKTERSENSIKGAAISYKGLENNLLVFKIDYKNELSKPFQLVIRNDQHEVLFKKAFDANPLNTSIGLSTPPEDCKITIAIETGNKGFSQAFEIDSKVKTVEEFEVKGI